ncbi:MAG: DUF1349 domain-containing protein [Eudoraea sp.]|nr:DUF1349 domain-containing protein [Eudoraea sp.]
MKRFSYTILVLCLVFGCKSEKSELRRETKAFPSNMTEENMAAYNWLNEPQSYKIVDNSLVVTVAKGTDFFNNPEDDSITSSAPFLYKILEGDFVAKVLVRPDFSSQWNAVALMVYLDDLNWIKFAFENSDATGPGIVTVVTKGTSDDANGVIIENMDEIWLAIVKKNDIYSMHWSEDGENYTMARLTKMTESEEVKIGIEFQSPVGDTATHTVRYFETEMRTIQDLRLLN